MTDRSIIEYFAEHEGYNCGYCKSENTCYSHGMWAHKLTPIDYQNLIDRGWRRSGRYCYKPTMNLICCPQYAIRCEAKKFMLSKSQRKLLKRVHKFLAHGQSEKTSPLEDSDEQVMEVSEFNQVADIQRLKNLTNVKDVKADEINSDMIELEHIKADQFKDISDSVSNCGDVKTTQSSQSQNSDSKSGTSQRPCSLDPMRPPCRKAKDIRKERRVQKLIKAGKTAEEISAVEGKKTSQPKCIEDFLSQPFPSEPAHKLELRLVPSDLDHPLFSHTFEESYSVYQKYQMFIHKDPAEKCSKKQYTRFLVNSPFQHSRDTVYGSFHQQYWLDDKLLAVAVIDILPFCVSSVYFYYDPDYSFLSLGTYAALREIAFTRELSKRYTALQYYYMGFYIHTCVKMRYKGQYSPSYLLCPETFIFQKIEQCKPKLEISKYHRLEEDPNKVDTDGVVNLSEVMLLFDKRPMAYLVYREINSFAADEDVIRQYAGFVGKKCYRRMLLYRN